MHFRNRKRLLCTGETKKELTARLRAEGYYYKDGDGWRYKDRIYWEKIAEGATHSDAGFLAWNALAEKHPRPAKDVKAPVVSEPSPSRDVAGSVSCVTCGCVMSVNDCPRVSFSCPMCGQLLRMREKLIGVELVAVRGEQ